MRIVFGQPKAPVAPLGGLLQRQCACGNHADGSECAEGSKKKRTLERAARDSGGTGRQGDAAPSIVHEVLRSPGEALDSRTRAFMAAPSATQQASLDRANLMLGLVAGATAQAQPVAARTRPEKTIAVDTVKLDGSTHNPSTQVDMAKAILSQCNVRVTHGVNATATNAQTTSWLGGDTILSVLDACGGVSTEGRRLYNGASLAFGFGGRYRAFFVADFNGIRASGYSLPPYCATGSAAPFRYSAYIDNGGDSATLAHELGHILINSGAHPVGTVMGSRPAAPAMKRPRFTDPQCTTLHSNA